VASFIVALSGQANAGGGNDAKKIFNQRCTACHTYGKGVKVGPDLKASPNGGKDRGC
jgi:cytochrome c2